MGLILRKKNSIKLNNYNIMSDITDQIELLKKKCLHLFGRKTPPSADEVSDSTGSEIPLFKSDFADKPWWEIKDKIIDYNFDNLPHFTAKALHYYFPAFLLFALNKFSATNDVLEFLIYELSPDERLDKDYYLERKAYFSREETAIVIDFLKLISADENMRSFHDDALKGIEFWQNAKDFRDINIKHGRVDES